MVGLAFVLFCSSIVRQAFAGGPPRKTALPRLARPTVVMMGAGLIPNVPFGQKRKRRFASSARP